jgi:hypothetical protein
LSSAHRRATGHDRPSEVGSTSNQSRKEQDEQHTNDNDGRLSAARASDRLPRCNQVERDSSKQESRISDEGEGKHFSLSGAGSLNNQQPAVPDAVRPAPYNQTKGK